MAYFTLFLFYIAIVGVFVFAWWRIWEKAGYKGIWALLMVIPVVNIAAFLYLAFSDWPVHRFLDQLDDDF